MRSGKREHALKIRCSKSWAHNLKDPGLILKITVLKRFRNYCGLIKIARSGFPWEKSTKRSVAPPDFLRAALTEGNDVRLSSRKAACSSMAPPSSTGNPGSVYTNCKTAVALALLCTAFAYGSDLPETPKPKPVMTKTSLLVAGSLVASRALDWATTEECLRRPWCHEGELPNILVHSKAGLAAFEASTSGLSIFAQYEMAKHGHKNLASMVSSFQSA